jgi:hypothetical protein
MSERVVDGLETIQIKEQQRHQLVLPRCPSYRLVETVQQQTSIRKAGQLVVICELARLCHCFVQQGNLLLKKRLLCPQLIDQAKGSLQPLLAGRQRAAERCGVRRRRRGSLPGRVRGSVGSSAGRVKQALLAGACSDGGMLTAVPSSRRHSFIAVAGIAKAFSHRLASGGQRLTLPVTWVSRLCASAHRHPPQFQGSQSPCVRKRTVTAKRFEPVATPGMRKAFL